MADKLRLKRGYLRDLPAQLSPGTVYVTLDEAGMYIDTGNSRVRLGNFIPVNTVNELPLTGHDYDNALFYIREGNILARWKAGIDGSVGKWIQINKAGVVAVQDKTGTSGNIISDITLHTNEIGQLSLEITRTTVATSSDLEDLRAIVQRHDSTLTTLTGTGDGSIIAQVEAAKAALLGGATQYTTLKQIEDALSALTGRVGVNETDITNLKNAVNILNGPKTTSGSVAYSIAQALMGIESDVDTLKTNVTNLTSTVEVHDGQLHWEDFSSL